jgi:alkanesulfonate monooxygenase SsuD/methylene tetrahydromethanopterin reductase-like flavin-dependent oxidoreductase (luciferase family)
MAGWTAGWAELSAMARRLDELSFDSVWVIDNLLYREPARDYGVWEGSSLLTAVAAVTERIEVGSLVTCAGFRNPALLAKLTDTVDEISGGRLTLGLGAGDNEDEHRAFGIPWEGRFTRIEEVLPILRGLFRDGRTDFDGEFFQIADCVLRPRGPRPDGPPIMVGSRGGPRMARAIARYADIWNTWLVYTDNDPASAQLDASLIDAACQEAGRDPATLERAVSVCLTLPGHDFVLAEMGLGRRALSGSPAELAEALRLLADQGISHVQVFLGPSTVEGIETFADVLRILDGTEP